MTDEMTSLRQEARDVQTKAIKTEDRNLIVVAGAGTGKTYALVNRYLHLLDTDSSRELSHLVAITFTEAAALEMRSRVRRALEERLHETDTQEARERWARLLAQMDTARISTIHGLCATLLRTNAAEAGIDPGFQVLDETEADLLLERAVDDVLQSLADDDPDSLLSLFSQYDTSQIREILIDQTVIHADLPALSDDPDDLYQQQYQRWHQTMREEISLLKQDSDFYHLLMHFDPPVYPLPEGDRLTPSVRNLLDGRAAIFDLSDEARIREAVETIHWLASSKRINLSGGTQKNWGGKDERDAVKGWLRASRDRFKDVIRRLPLFDEARERQAAILILRWMTLIRRVQQTYQQAKADAALMDFDDLERGAATLLAESEAVRDRYRQGEIQHLMVDEFQDTNEAQWQIVQSLTDLNRAGSVFLVGDPKQSIYAFRGADVSVFNRVRQFIASHQTGEELLLTGSFRSSENLLAIINRLFESLLQPTVGSPAGEYEVSFGEALIPQRAEESPETPVELLLLNKKPDGASLTVDVTRPWEAYEIGKRLRQMVEEGVQILDKEAGEMRDVTYGDVVVLLRALTNINLYEDAFKALGIPYRTVSGRGYYHRQEIADLLNVLKVVHNPADNLSLASALRSPMFNLSDEVLLALRLMHDEDNEPLTLYEAMTVARSQEVSGIAPEAQKAMQFAFNVLGELRDLAGRESIAGLLRVLLERTGYLAILTGLDDGTRRRLNVEKFLQIADDTGSFLPDEFARYVDGLTDRDVREGEAYVDAEGMVTFMSIHASKGLEFPVVCLADAASGGRGGSSSIALLNRQNNLSCKVYDESTHKHEPSWLYQYETELQKLRDDAERLRLLYVAATRARDRLLISGVWNAEQETASGWLGQILDIVQDVDRNDDAILFTETGQIRVIRPDYATYLENSLSVPEVQNPLEMLHESAHNTEPKAPALMESLQIAPETFMGHISATRLADLGDVFHSDYSEHKRASLRRRFLHAKVDYIQPAIRPATHAVSQRIIGNIVHEALRYWRFPDSVAEMDTILEGYAWQWHITEPSQVAEAVSRARRLLQQFQQSQVYRWITESQQAGLPVYPELPFIYQTGKRIIHGVIDVFFQRPDGTYVVLDYKTGFIRGMNGPRAKRAQIARDHARRYHLQVGAYAAAVQEQLPDVIPDVYVYFLGYNQAVQIPTATWQAELANLETYIGDLTHDLHD